MLAAAFLFALVGAAFFGSYAGMRSRDAHHPTAQPSAQSGSTYIVKEPEEIWEKFLDPVAIFTAALALVTYLMARAITEQVRLARAEFNATHRPQIMVHGFDLSHEYRGDEGEAISADFVVVNKGTTDAILEDISGIIFAARHLRPGNEMRSLGHKGHVLTSGETLKGIGIDGTPASAHAAQIEFAHGYGETPRRILWCVGKIIYADRQGRKRETGFCRRYDPEGHRWLQEPNSDYEYSY